MFCNYLRILLESGLILGLKWIRVREIAMLIPTEEMRKIEGIIDNFERWNRNESGKTTK